MKEQRLLRPQDFFRAHERLRHLIVIVEFCRSRENDSISRFFRRLPGLTWPLSTSPRSGKGDSNTLVMAASQRVYKGLARGKSPNFFQVNGSSDEPRMLMERPQFRIGGQAFATLFRFGGLRADGILRTAS